jgi:hypothetical protein
MGFFTCWETPNLYDSSGTNLLGTGTMSALGQKQTLERFSPMSALPPKADIDQHGSDGRRKFRPFNNLTVKRPQTPLPRINDFRAICKMILVEKIARPSR